MLLFGVVNLISMQIVGVIPARYQSSRFPGKPLVDICGKSLIQRVIEQCQRAKTLSEVIVATDDSRIADHARQFCRVEMTSETHPSGTDRVAEVMEKLPDCDGAVNIQGDEPMIDPSVIDEVAHALSSAPMSTAASPIKNPDDYENTNVNKVILNQASNAIYFSRRTIPCVREHLDRPVSEQLQTFPFLKHLGIYGYQRDTLLQLVAWPVSQLEEAERLEQLRAIDHGIPIHVSVVDYESIGVDTPEDVQRIIDCL
jgi:3-deoxy-manno-octulosonate cytidylyltransferase (CMP-KDO synthetase)